MLLLTLTYDVVFTIKTSSFVLQNQLHLIYQCVSTQLTCGTTVIKTGEIGSLVQQMARRDSTTKSSGFEKEYKVRLIVITVIY